MLEEWLYTFLNPIFYSIRNGLRFQRTGYRGAIHSDRPEVRKKAEAPRVRELVRKYALDEVESKLPPGDFLAACFFLDVLDQLFSRSSFIDLSRKISLLDVGAKNFESAPGLYHAFKYGKTSEPRSVHLTGIEIDAYRVYRGFFSRADAAAFVLSNIENDGEPHEYIGGDVLEHRGQYEVITWFYPFLYASPLLAWGLPKRFLKPEKMFQHVLSLIKPGGICVIVNQEAEERDAQIELFRREKVEFESFEFNYETKTRDTPAFVHVLKAPRECSPEKG